jgi:hypothetical protein
VSGAAVAGPEMPAVEAGEALGDRVWFTRYPYRRYRMRQGEQGWWLIRRRSGGVMLRTWTAALPRGLPDRDSALREAWVAAAWPGLNPIERAELTRTVKKGERLHEP